MATSAANSSSAPTTTTPTTKLDDSPPLLIKKLSPKARTPTRGSAGAAGYDLYASVPPLSSFLFTLSPSTAHPVMPRSAHATTIPSRGKTLVDTDLAIAVPSGTCASPSVWATVVCIPD